MQTETSRKLSNYLYTICEYGSYNSIVIDLRKVVCIETVVDKKEKRFMLYIMFDVKEMIEAKFKCLENLQEEFKDIRAAWEEMLSES